MGHLTVEKLKVELIHGPLFISAQASFNTVGVNTLERLKEEVKSGFFRMRCPLPLRMVSLKEGGEKMRR